MTHLTFQPAFTPPQVPKTLKKVIFQPFLMVIYALRPIDTRVRSYYFYSVQERNPQKMSSRPGR